MARPGVDRATFAVAVIMLTVAVTAIPALAIRERLGRVWGWIAVIIAGGLLVNAAGHAVQSIVALTPVPGSLPDFFSWRRRPHGFWPDSKPCQGARGIGASSRCPLARRPCRWLHSPPCGLPKC